MPELAPPEELTTAEGPEQIAGSDAPPASNGPRASQKSDS
jgi:hypothetical protein